MSLRKSWQQKVVGSLTGLLLLGAGTVLAPTLARAQDNDAVAAQADQRLQTLQEQGGPELVTAFRSGGQDERPALRFLGTSKDRPLPVAMEGEVGAAAVAPEGLARAFLRQYGDLFGLQNEASDLRTARTWSVADETVGTRQFVRFQQLYQGVPVLGGDFTVQSTPQGILSAGGRIVTAAQLHGLTSVIPQITAEQARSVALKAVAKMYGVDGTRLTGSAPSLAVYHPSIFQNRAVGAPNLPCLVWQLVVRDAAHSEIDEFVLVDAQRGGIALHFNQHAAALKRTIYDNHNDPTLGPAEGQIVRREGEVATGDSDVDWAYDYVGKTYDFYQTYFNRDGLDGHGIAVPITVRYCKPTWPCPLLNSYGGLDGLEFGEGIAQADDMVAHEYTHGVTDSESNLFYYMQSGAISEALSDIFGEYSDLTNGVGNDTPEVRWLFGEDLPNGWVRDMRTPARSMQPDSMTSDFYVCTTYERDDGGVHTNSGVANKAAFLMTDGGSLNGVTVQGLGITKASHIWYEVATNLLNAASDYQDLSDALPQACTNLIGSWGITASDCQQVRKVVTATAMSQPPRCVPPVAPVCPAGQQPSYLFQDDLEDLDSGKWQVAMLTGDTNWYYPTRSNPDLYLKFYANSGIRSLIGFADGGLADGAVQMTQDVSLPAGSTPYLHFNHSYDFEQLPFTQIGADGGLLEYSTDQGATWQAFDAFAADNGYTGSIAPYWGNPLAGRRAFIGATYGYGSSRFNLAPLAGQQMRVRFRLATDAENTWGGMAWFIDDIDLYTCGAGEPPETPPSRQVTITLDVLPDSAANFRFESSFGSFALDDAALPDSDVYSNTKRVSLPAGEYTVTVGAASKWLLAGITCTPSSAAVVASDQRTVTLNTSASDVACTFTEQRKASILARSYNDLNGSGTKNSNEPPLPGWTITISSSLLTAPLQGVTNELGKVNFTRLAPGSYTVCLVQQEGWVNTQPAESLPCHTVTLAPGFKTRVYFGNQQSTTRSTTIGSPPLDEVFSTLATDEVDGEEAADDDRSDWFQLDLNTADSYFTAVGTTEVGADALQHKLYLPVVEQH